MTKLGVNIDHVATIRQARLTSYPDILAAALAAERGGADGITAHLREDRRHIQDSDIVRLRSGIATKLNLEMAATPEMVEIACRVRPHDVCIVPERRLELTTEGGLDAAGQRAALKPIVEQLRASRIRVSLFIDPDRHQVDAAAALACEAVELHTGRYAETHGSERDKELERLRLAAAHAVSSRLTINAGHGLTLDNVGEIVAIASMNELNIGHSIVADAIFFGMEAAVRRMKAAIAAARH